MFIYIEDVRQCVLELKMVMEVQKINSRVYAQPPHSDSSNESNTVSSISNSINGNNSVSFKGGKPDFTKRFMRIFRELSNVMKDPSEMTNTLIATIGTGIIAPFAILCSPSKKNENVQDKKQAKEKKKFQALRQPVSAVLAFVFQLPAIIGIKAAFDHMAYKKQLPIFNDADLNTLVPSKKYLTEQAEKALKENASQSIKDNWSEELKLIKDKEAELNEEFKKFLAENDREVGIDISDSELEKLAENSKRKKRKFLSEKMASAKREKLMLEKIEELKAKKTFDIKDLDLVSEEYMDLARLRNKEEFAKLRNDANLSVFDKFVESMGLSNRKLKKYKEAEEALAKERGLTIMKNEESTVFTDVAKRFERFIKNKDVKAQEIYSNKVFWFTLLTNLGMVAISCIALNWLHPKFADFVENRKARKNGNDSQQNDKKVEVRA